MLTKGDLVRDISVLWYTLTVRSWIRGWRASVYSGSGETKDMVIERECSGSSLSGGQGSGRQNKGITYSGSTQDGAKSSPDQGSFRLKSVETWRQAEVHNKRGWWRWSPANTQRLFTSIDIKMLFDYLQKQKCNGYEILMLINSIQICSKKSKKESILLNQNILFSHHPTSWLVTMSSWLVIIVIF